MAVQDWLSGKLLVRRLGVAWATALVTLGTFVIVSTIIVIAARQTHFPILPGILVTVLIHLVLLPQTYQTHAAIAELDQTRAKLYHQSITDELTGAYNRRFFVEELEQAIGTARREGVPFALMQFDLDDFKLVNDTYGHQFGDEVLQTISALCRQNARQSDVFARMGGEEFAFLLRAMAQDDALRFAERIRLAIGALPLTAHGQQLRVTISAGVSSYRAGRSVDEILRLGDHAMYQAKANGKNRIVAEAG